MNALTLERNDGRTNSDPAMGVRAKECPSRCALCAHYQLHGRRGGNCQLLNVTVQGEWKACSLALPAFTPFYKDSGLMRRSPAEVLKLIK
ncbi:hypothetical protein [Kamptonema sp. UHCC 0994]|uniref:hypothetical protein n=1 Tax=Kamptonema sp. UHCC 0994 TaxID=3031329 RepID=UPI0023B8BA18|nr:hypothetical protein [Kamptonema sp. UHCC 0994]MDF0552783.1 hypothetical protein [Kamptonema sp. UHCC 0994]